MPIHPEVKRIIVAAALLLFAVPAFGQQASLAEASACKAYRIAERMQPAWSISADWLKPDVLVLADSVGGMLLHYTPSGRFLGRDPATLGDVVSKSTNQDFRPAGLSVRGSDAAWLQLLGGRFVQVDNRYGKVRESLNLSDLPAGHDRTIAAVYDWTVSDNDLIGFGNLRDSAGTWSTGFFRVNLHDQSKAAVVEELERFPPERVWYRLGFHYLTAIDQFGYGFEIDEANDRLRLVAIPPIGESIRPLDVSLRALDNPPDLADYTTPEEYIQLMEEVEASTMPVGLYGWNGDLYVVWREHSRQQGQRWWLTKIAVTEDATGGVSAKVAGTMRLPSTANHLMVVPGPKYWALVEKGPVEGFGIQEERVVRYIPSSMVDAFKSGGVLCR